MRILFLDDNESRHKALEHIVVGACVTHMDWVQDAKTAIKCLSDNPKYDVICFDHDLSDEHYRAFIEHGENADYGVEMTGYDVAVFLVTELDEEKQPDYAIVHTFNSNGAKRITTALNEAGLQKAIYVFPFNPSGFEQAINHITLSNGN
jgi:CheY-like chemotaxis protein